jgi:hypothetical protein
MRERVAHEVEGRASRAVALNSHDITRNYDDSAGLHPLNESP